MSLNHIAYVTQQKSPWLSCNAFAALLIQSRRPKQISRPQIEFKARNFHPQFHFSSLRRQKRGQLARLNVLSSEISQPSSPPPSRTGLPKHLAVIMDGNSRWAQQRHLPSFSGHQSGVDALRRTVEFSRNHNIKALTVFAFSSENWQRTNEEAEFLLMLIERVVEKELEELVAAGVNMQFIGDRSKLPSSLLDQMKRYERAGGHLF